MPTITIDSTKEEVLIALSTKEPQGENTFTVAEHMHPSLLNDEEIMLALVKRNGFALKYAPTHFKNNPKIVLEAIKQHGWALAYASGDLKKDMKFMLTAVSENPWALRHAPGAFTRDKTIILQAVRKNGWALQWAAPALRDDIEVVLAAFHYADSPGFWSEKVLSFASQKIQNKVAEYRMNYGGSIRQALWELKHKSKIDKIYTVGATLGAMDSAYTPAKIDQVAKPLPHLPLRVTIYLSTFFTRDEGGASLACTGRPAAEQAKKAVQSERTKHARYTAGAVFGALNSAYTSPKEQAGSKPLPDLPEEATTLMSAFITRNPDGGSLACTNQEAVKQARSIMYKG